MFRDILQPTLTAIEDSLDSMLGSYFDAIGLLLMVRRLVACGLTVPAASRIFHHQES